MSSGPCMLRECLYFVSGLLGECLQCQKCLDDVFSVKNAWGCLQCKECLECVFSVKNTCWCLQCKRVLGWCLQCKECLDDVISVKSAWMMSLVSWMLGDVSCVRCVWKMSGILGGSIQGHNELEEVLSTMCSWGMHLLVLKFNVALRPQRP